MTRPQKGPQQPSIFNENGIPFSAWLLIKRLFSGRRDSCHEEQTQGVTTRGSLKSRCHPAGIATARDTVFSSFAETDKSEDDTRLRRRYETKSSEIFQNAKLP
ncbi:hypothetical protein AVEN_200783-1 [Araneus ventricosus]|uniref:Uncharacterized protein n=1 Tax=Araneus ventricosus TaxID=182803 RepID=A0A4Y2DYH0_ARAVE|nr:hypothetical protein AVEN_200783-1 [Araneus ventricosus]